MRNIRWVVVHTAAADHRNVDADEIDRLHLERGWSGIGYHYAILDDRHDTKTDGTVEEGRKEDISGAHARGINSQSIGICCAGHGDVRPFTEKQMESLITLCAEICRRYELPAEAVIGHFEINRLIAEGKVAAKYKTSKTCPGTKVSMPDIRAAVRKHLADGKPLSVEDRLADLERRVQLIEGRA